MISHCPTVPFAHCFPSAAERQHNLATQIEDEFLKPEGSWRNQEIRFSRWSFGMSFALFQLMHVWTHTIQAPKSSSCEEQLPSFMASRFKLAPVQARDAESQQISVNRKTYWIMVPKCPIKMMDIGWDYILLQDSLGKPIMSSRCKLPAQHHPNPDCDTHEQTARCPKSLIRWLVLNDKKNAVKTALSHSWHLRGLLRPIQIPKQLRYTHNWFVFFILKAQHL